MKMIALRFVIAASVVALVGSCSKHASPTGSSTPAADQPAAAGSPTADPPNEADAEADAATSWAPMASFDYPDVPGGLPAGLPPAEPLDTMVVLAWNDLGMHCYQPDFSMFQILPPHNVFWAQVIARGEQPKIVTAGVELHYTTLHVTEPARHTNFWDYAGAYGWQLEPGKGLTGNGMSGRMEAAEDHFVAEGVPVVDTSDDGVWDPFPMFTVSVHNPAGDCLAQTVNVAPASSEMACDLCHEADSMHESMAAILSAHDKREGSDLLKQAAGGKPVRCSSCHADPAMGAMENKDCESSLSSAMHRFHADKFSEAKRELPKNQCHACHPGPKTKCLRDIMSQSGLTCTDCHGGMATVGDPARIAWVNMPSCTTCHTDALEDPEAFEIESPNQHLTANAESLYRHSKAHGGGGIYCAACHGSPHAVTPTATERDNQQAIRLQGHKGPIAECTVCHLEKPDAPFWHFREPE